MKEGENMGKKSKPQSPLIQEYRKQRRRIQQFIRRAEKRGYQFAENILPTTPKKITQQSVERLRKLTPEKLYKKSTYGGEATYGEIVKGSKARTLERKQAAQKAAETRKERQLYKQRPEPEPVEYDYSDYDYYDDIVETEEPEIKKSIDDLKREAKLDFVKGQTDYRENVSQDTSFFARTVVANFRLTLNSYNDTAKNKLNSWLNTLVGRFGEEDVAQMITQAMEDGVELTVKDSYFTEKVSDYMQKMMDYLPEAGEFTKQDIMESLEEEDLYEEPL